MRQNLHFQMIFLIITSRELLFSDRKLLFPNSLLEKLWKMLGSNKAKFQLSFLHLAWDLVKITVLDPLELGRDLGRNCRSWTLQQLTKAMFMAALFFALHQVYSLSLICSLQHSCKVFCCQAPSTNCHYCCPVLHLACFCNSLPCHYGLALSAFQSTSILKDVCDYHADVIISLGGTTQEDILWMGFKPQPH